MPYRANAQTITIKVPKHLTVSSLEGHNAPSNGQESEPIDATDASSIDRESSMLSPQMDGGRKPRS